MTRTVIEFSQDISPMMAELSQVIEGCAYSPLAKVVAFNVSGLRVVADAHTLTVYGTEDEGTVRAIIDQIRKFFKETGSQGSRHLRNETKGGPR